MLLLETEVSLETGAGTTAPEDPVVADAPDAPETTAPSVVAEETLPEVVAEAPPAPPEPLAPSFDTFRVETDGSMVIAGRAAPGQIVDIVLAGEAIDRVTADDIGAFVAFSFAGPSDQPRRLLLVADPDGLAVESLTSYIVAPIAAPVVLAEVEPVTDDSPVLAEPVGEAAPVTDAETPTPEDITAADTSVPVIAETATDAPDDAPLVETTPAAPPTVLQADAQGVRVVQGAQAAATDNVALDAITYDAQGEVQLSGRATSDQGEVQVYIDNQPLAAAPITAGDWRLDLPSLDTGVYTLRVDEVDTVGTVVSRIETPFKREEPAEVAAVLAEETAQEGFEVAVRTVQPGSTLWAIAEATLGSGILYVEVFEANRDLIRDPDLIYPGQIFRIPGVTE
ncbi:LysM peptidoglycan-binding domain-containing protein [Yoonia sp.]|uniref:LysM peptidoglycan-binding domain-containing protein n=1 Tax=Yoonia sp. TaxID=2212373 RepID=UPI002FDA4D2F